MLSAARRRAAWVPAAFLLLLGCAARPTPGPDTLRAAYARALRDDDPGAAYALLSPELRATVTRTEFEDRWRAQGEARAAALSVLEADAPAQVVTAGTTAHPNGQVLRWVAVDGRYLVIDGLPGLPDRATPEATVRAFIAAARAVDRRQLDALLAEELHHRTRAALESRLDALERALAQPGAFEYAQGSSQAVLRFGPPEGATVAPEDEDASGALPGRKMTLEREESGWRIVALD